MTTDVLGLVGRVVDQVRFDACVDEGGFGLVYRGHHLGLDETVAIKCLHVPGLTMDEDRDEFSRRFRDETKLLYRLSQGSLDIVRCIGSGTLVSGTTGDLVPYMVLEWLQGRSLAAELKDRRTRSMPARSLEEAVALLDNPVAGLAYAHAHGVIHRDVKPGNIFLAETMYGPRAKILDFGFAKIVSDHTIGMRSSVQTAKGTQICSPSYGAPEQLSHRFGSVGAWTDVYSLALVLLELMIGRKVRPALTLAESLIVALDPTTGSPRPSSLGLQLPMEAEAVLFAAVAQRPQQRPADAGIFWGMLKNAMRPSVRSSSYPPAFADTVSMPSPGPVTVAPQSPSTAPLAAPVAKASTGTAPLARPFSTPSRPPDMTHANTMKMAVSLVLVVIAAVMLGAIAIWVLKHPN